jgi:hypothetical protein
MIYKNCGKGDKFATDGMERARIIAFADVNDKDLFVDALVKGMIGGDSIEINAKSVRQFQSRPKAKMIACTNVMPNIRDNIAEKRRWIFCSVAGFDGITDPLSRNVAAIKEHTRSRLTTDRIIKYLVKHYGAETLRVCKNNEVIRCIRGVRMNASALNAVNCSNTADSLTGG